MAAGAFATRERTWRHPASAGLSEGIPAGLSPRQLPGQAGCERDAGGGRSGRRAEHPCGQPAHPAAEAGEPCAALLARLSHGAACLPRHAWAHGRDSAPWLPALAASPAAPAFPWGFVPEPPRVNRSPALCRSLGDQGPGEEEGSAFLSEHSAWWGLCEGGRRRGTTHKGRSKGISWCGWEQGSVPPGRIALP